jgi:predicted transcriptional regulator
MAKPKAVFEELDEEAEGRTVEEAEADIAAGRLIPHDEVVEWLKTWGTANERPAPAPRKR